MAPRPDYDTLHRQRWLSPDGRSDGGYREQDASSAWTSIEEIFGCPHANGCVPEPADFSDLPDDPDLILDYLHEHPIGDEHAGTGILGLIWSRLENGYVPPSV